MKPSRVFLVDDHDAILEMLGRLLHDMGLEVAGTARSGAEAIPMILALNPDLAVLDLSMPGKNGFDVVEALRAKGAACRFLLFTGVVGAHALERINHLRFDGLVSKISRLQELRDGIRVVIAGGSYRCKVFQALREKHLAAAQNPPHLLTKREVEVLALIGEAKSDAEISSELPISSSTAQSVRTKIIKKLGFQGTPQLVRFAQEHGYTEFALRPVHADAKDRVAD